MDLNHLTVAEVKAFRQQYPFLEGETHEQWLRRHNPLEPGETEVQWILRLSEDKDWVDYLFKWPCVDNCPISLSEQRTKDAKQSIYNVEFNRRRLFIGATDFKSKTSLLADKISNIMNKRVERSKKLNKLGRNPGGEEEPGRYGMLYQDKTIFHLIMRHLRVATTLDVNFGVKAWPYTNRLRPNFPGQAWGSRPPEAKENDPDLWHKLLADDLANPNKHRMLGVRVCGLKSKRINNSQAMEWTVLVNPTPARDRKHVLIRQHKLDHVPADERVTDDHEVYRPKCCPITGEPWQLWQYYGAVIPICYHGEAGTEVMGWINPEKARTYPCYENTDPLDLKRKAKFYHVPIDDLEPIETLLSCIEGWDKDQLLKDGLMFTK